MDEVKVVRRRRQDAVEAAPAPKQKRRGAIAGKTALLSEENMAEHRRVSRMQPRPVGRPTLYGPVLLQRAREYLQDPLVDEDGNFGWEVVHTLEGLAHRLGITTTTVQDWASQPEKPEFSVLVDQIRELQRRELLNNSLRGGFNPAIAKLMLAKHGYIDRTETDMTSSDGSMTPAVVERVIVRPDAEK